VNWDVRNSFEGCLPLSLALKNPQGTGHLLGIWDPWAESSRCWLTPEEQGHLLH
jgi:hypothetical protein